MSGQMSRFAVIFGFCTLIAGTQEIITSRGSWPQPQFYVFETFPPSLGLKISDNILKFPFKMV